MRLPARLKTRLDTRIPARMRSSVVETRYFRRNEGGTDYIDIPSVVISAGDTISFSYLAYTSTPEGNTFFFDREKGAGVRASLLFNSGGFLNNFPLWADARKDDGVVTNINSEVPMDGKIHRMEITVDSESTGKSIKILMANENKVSGYSGVMFDFEHKSSTGILLRKFEINDNSDTIIDSVSGQNGTVINGNPEDWGLFKRLPNGNWQGVDLSDAWDSPDQILDVV